ncbi:MAG TPA: ester cyclase [Vicinamibacterales bacterium]|nr:ester cyclase [Vicinamibacterales bacterium]
MAQVSELLDRFIELFNAGRYEEAEADFAPGGYSEEIGTGRRLTIKEATANARAWKEAFPDARGTITNKIVAGNKGAAEIVWRGTNRGSLMGNPATGRSVEVRAVVVIDTDGTKITRSTHYLDVAGMTAQLGGRAATATA